MYRKMSQAVFSFIIDAMEIIFVLYALNIIRNEEKGVKNILLYFFLYIPIFILFKDTGWNIYLVKRTYMLGVLIFYLFRYGMKVSEYIPILCALYGTYELLEILAAVIGGISMPLLSICNLWNDMIAKILFIFSMILFVVISIHIIKSKIINFKFSFSKKCIACFTYVFVIFGKIPFLYTSVQEAKVLKMIIITMVCCTIIFFVISRIERHNVEMERAKIEENNKNLSSKLHKSREIIPAVVQVLSDVTENSGKEMEEQETQKLLREMTDLFGQQLKENSKEDLQLKNFCSTGLKILDQQLTVYQMEAIDRGVNLDIYVQAPINDIIKRDDIDQLKLLRAVGDLVRNAFRITEKNKEEKCRANGHILLIIGCRYEGILEIEVVDNGDQFPIFVIEAFGSRGVTTGGTGNGLADLVEFADETKASLCVEEFAWETNAFTKKVSIIFDKQRKNYYNSERKEQVKSSFWEKLNSV